MVCRRIRAYLPKGKEAYHEGGEPEATKLNREKLKSLELEQQVSRTRGRNMVHSLLLLQDIKARLERLDQYTKTLNNHIAMVANVRPVTEDVVSYCMAVKQVIFVRQLILWVK